MFVARQVTLPSGMEQIGFGPSFKPTLCEMLESIPMFHDFSHSDITTLADYLQAYEAAPGIELFREGRHDSYMCLLVSGRLEVVKEVAERRHRHLAMIRPGKSIGEMAFFDGQPHSATVMVAEPSQLLMLTRMQMERLQENHPRLAIALILYITRLLSARLRQTSGHLVDRLS